MPTKKPPGPPTGQPTPSSGMGNPHEERFFFEQYRDTGQGEATAKDVVYDPSCAPRALAQRVGPARMQEIAALACELERMLRRQLWFVQKPAFQEPPFFAVPEILTSETLVAAGGVKHFLLVRKIPDRQRLVVVMTAMAINRIDLVDEISVWLERRNGEPIPFLTHQTGNVNKDAVASLPLGRAPRLPGGLDSPFCLLSNGLQLHLAGPDELVVAAINQHATQAVDVCVMLGVYQYRMSRSTEFFEGETQR